MTPTYVAIARRVATAERVFSPERSSFGRVRLRLQLLAAFIVFIAGSAFAQTAVNIEAIQTDLPASPYLGKSVTTSGIVIAVLADGFYIENSTWDNDVTTAEGIYVYTPYGVPAHALVGSDLTVTGTVEASNSSSYAGTQILISAVPVTASTGNALPSAVPSDALAIASTGAFGQWLRFEGMRISVPSLLVTGEPGFRLHHHHPRR